MLSNDREQKVGNKHESHRVALRVCACLRVRLISQLHQE